MLVPTANISGSVLMADRKRILVVDDERRNRNLLRAMLKSLGYDSDTAFDGMEAMAKIEQGYDLLLLDVMMPGMDGFEMTRRVREKTGWSDIPIIMVTALGSKEDRLRAVEAGANDYITKPIDKNELRIRTAALLKMKQAQEEVKHKLRSLESAVEERTAALHEARQRVAQVKESAFQSRVETVYRLARAAECRDGTTGAHIVRTQQFAAFVADKLGLPADDVNRIHFAAPLHDIGKLGIPDRILLKKGKLTREEFQIMKSHTTYGAQILADSRDPIFETARQIALSHHERWDGHGYPHGLLGREIPLPARIVSVVDAFDAITSKRPYSDARSFVRAYEIIEEERGRQFDAEIADEFLANIDGILEILKRMKQTQEHRHGEIADDWR
jgi:putative two-component system response regulator